MRFKEGRGRMNPDRSGAGQRNADRRVVKGIPGMPATIDHRTRGQDNLLEDPKRIKEGGINKFGKEENQQRKRGTCGPLLCVHEPTRPNCNFAWRT
jgi:hypothetical protein